MLQKTEDPLNTQTGVFANPFESDEFEGTAEDLGTFGIKVNRSTKGTPVYRSAASD